MGAGQVGGIATLLDIDFDNAAGFIGEKPKVKEAQFLVMYLSHTMMFCVGSLLEAHVVLTPASCVYSETHKFEVYGGTHRFREYTGIERRVNDICVHKGFNATLKFTQCMNNNLALLVLNQPFSLIQRDPNAQFVINRLRYIVSPQPYIANDNCRYYGWGSRRNGFLVPINFDLRRVNARVLKRESCMNMFHSGERFVCVEMQPCEDDVGTILVCSGHARGMMVTRLIDRPCGVGFIDLIYYGRFLKCAVDDARDIIDAASPELNQPATTARLPEALTLPAKTTTLDPSYISLLRSTTASWSVSGE